MGMDLNYKLIGHRLRAARKKMGLTQEQVAESANISPQHISGVETGSAKISLPTLVRLCDVLNITPNDILMDSFKQSETSYHKEIAAVFADCSPDEMYLMLSQAENLKKALRIKGFRGKTNIP